VPVGEIGENRSRFAIELCTVDQIVNYILGAAYGKGNAYIVKRLLAIKKSNPNIYATAFDKLLNNTDMDYYSDLDGITLRGRIMILFRALRWIERVLPLIDQIDEKSVQYFKDQLDIRDYLIQLMFGISICMEGDEDEVMFDIASDAGIHQMRHMIEVTELAIIFAYHEIDNNPELKINIKGVIAGAFMHDLGQVWTPRSHEVVGTYVARTVLFSLGLEKEPVSYIEDRTGETITTDLATYVESIIFQHSTTSNDIDGPDSFIDARIVKDADDITASKVNRLLQINESKRRKFFNAERKSASRAAFIIVRSDNYDLMDEFGAIDTFTALLKHLVVSSSRSNYTTAAAEFFSEFDLNLTA